MRFDQQRRCSALMFAGQAFAGRCELRDDHEGEHQVGLSRAHGPPWEYDRCFHFAGGDGTRCVLIHGHEGPHEIDSDESFEGTITMERPSRWEVLMREAE